MGNEELQRVLDEVEQQEAAGSINPLPEDDAPTSILEAEPEAGQIVSRKSYPVFGAIELTLSNGMKVSRENMPPNTMLSEPFVPSLLPSFMVFWFALSFAVHIVFCNSLCIIWCPLRCGTHCPLQCYPKRPGASAWLWQSGCIPDACSCCSMLLRVPSKNHCF